MTTDDTDVRAEVAALRAEVAELSGRLDLLRDAHVDELTANRRAHLKAAKMLRKLAERHLALREDHEAMSDVVVAVAAGAAVLAGRVATPRPPLAPGEN